MSNFRRNKASRFEEGDLSYMNQNLLLEFLTENGKIVPSRITGLPTRYQRALAREIKRARFLALLPYCDSHK